MVALLAEGVDRNFESPRGGRTAGRSPSSRRAWIEICETCSRSGGYGVALLAEGVDRNAPGTASERAPCRSPSSRRAWIEMQKQRLSANPRPTSPSSRRAWIEIWAWRNCSNSLIVALLAEGVDRNVMPCGWDRVALVALLAEGVDRNVMPCGWDRVALVALLAEGVDRNTVISPSPVMDTLSPSSRRAWIEIVCGQ